MQKYQQSIISQTEGGIGLNEKAPNISLQTPSGDTIELGDLLGKYVLLDFWASWCQPCRMENPNIVKIYEKYHYLGLELFSVSLDANAIQWKKAIEMDKLAWQYHGCDFKGWQSKPAQDYKVDAIPSTFLIDKKGKVIAKNLHGIELEKKLNELLSK